MAVRMILLVSSSVDKSPNNELRGDPLSSIDEKKMEKGWDFLWIQGFGRGKQETLLAVKKKKVSVFNVSHVHRKKKKNDEERSNE